MKSIWWIILAVVLIGAGFLQQAATGRHAARLTTALLTADTNGTDTSTKLAELKSYIHNHTGTHATFTLQGAYARAVAVAQVAAEAQATNSQIYAAAQAACSGKADSIVQAKCNAAYLQQHLVAMPATTSPVPPELSSYQYHLKSPAWVPDVTGSLFAGAFVALILGAITLMRRRVS